MTNPSSQRLTIGGEIARAEDHLTNALILLDLALRDFKTPAERQEAQQVRSRIATAQMYCRNVSGNVAAMVKL